MQKQRTECIDKIFCGNTTDILKTLPSDLVDCCVCSPPYYGLRSYLPEGHPDKALEIGLEESPEAYVGKLVDVFREVRRVLKDDGIMFLNLGDSYAGSGKGGQSEEKRSENWQPQYGNKGKRYGLKPKDLIGIPWMVAFALRADGWYLRQDIIWSKNNCMPESVTDRCTKSHEYLFLFAKSRRYYFDSEAIKESSVSDHPSGNGFKRPARVSYQNPDGTARGNEEQWRGVGGKRNKRSVWQVNTVPYREAHFATFPEKLIEPCILAGTSERGICPECGKPWIRQIKSTGGRDWHNDKMVSKGIPGEILGDDGYKRGQSATQLNDTKQHVTIGWLPSCQCGDLKPVPGIVLDPFFGAGTTGLVAKKLGRHFIGIELNEAYIGMAQKRIAATPVRLDNWM